MNRTPNFNLPYVEEDDFQSSYPAVSLDLATLLDQALTGKANGSGMTVRVDTTVGTRVLLDHPGGTLMLSGDTGWRDISGLLLNEWTGILRIRRENQTIHLSGQSLVPGTSSVVMTGIPAAWRPLLRTPISAQIEGASPVRGTVQPTGVLNIDNTSAFPREIAGSWSIPHAWPTTHLGNPTT